jgi:hypothetical protein
MSKQYSISSNAIVVAAVVGVAAAGLTYLFVSRPRWRSRVVEMAHLALDVVGNILKHPIEPKE